MPHGQAASSDVDAKPRHRRGHRDGVMRFVPRVSPVVDAVRITRGSVPEIQRLIEGSDLRIAYVDGMQPGFKPQPENEKSKVVVLGTITPLFAYDEEWLVRDAAGNFRRLDADEFAKTYEPVV